MWRWILGCVLYSTVCFAQVTADFSGRNGGTVIPANWQGANDMHHLDATSTSTLVGAGVEVSRLSLQMQQIYPSGPTPDFSVPDAQADLAATRGYKILGYIQNTPSDLGASICSQPSNVTTWASRAAAVIAHEESRHPGLFVGWGVWNEEDLAASYCPATGTNLTNFIALYAAAAPAMIAQVVADSSAAPVGPGGLGAPGANAAAFLSSASTGLLGNSGTAPYVQYVDYHSYIGGCTVSWSACFSALQNASTGQNAVYAAVNTLVRAGSQPNASTTPILITEYNDSSIFNPPLDPVRNDATNGPLWNAVSVIDWLNNSPIPQGVWYYNAASSGSATGFCLFGDTAAGTCPNPPLNPYPQFYLYQMINSPAYLNLGVGGHLAASVSPGSSTSGLQATAFYTTAGNSIVIANPTSSPISTGTITFNNAGMSVARGTLFTLNASNPTIASAPITLTPITGGFTAASQSVPANSTIALSIATTNAILAGKVTLSGKATLQ